MEHSINSSDQQTVVDMSKDMRFVGIFGIITGALYCLSIFGAILGIPYIIAGLRLRDAADYFNRYAAAGDTVNLQRAFEKQKSVFNIVKILLIIGLVLSVVGIIFAVMLVAGGFMMEQMQAY